MEAFDSVIGSGFSMDFFIGMLPGAGATLILSFLTVR
jgi:hypothetical protein